MIDDGGPDALTIRAEEGEWREIYPGVQRKTLYRNEADGTQSYLLRIAPGAEFPAHLPDKLEECYFLEGEVIMGAERFHAGDYHAALPGSDHQVITSRAGALLLIRGGVKAA